MLEIHLRPRSGRLALKIIQSGPIRVSGIQMLNDLIRAGFQFKKTDREPNQVLLKLLLLLGRQLTNKQRFSMRNLESRGFHSPILKKRKERERVNLFRQLGKLQENKLLGGWGEGGGSRGLHQNNNLYGGL